MINQRYQRDIIINDRSGSIEAILAGMQDGFDEFVKWSTNSALGRYTRSAAGSGGQSASFSYNTEERAAAVDDGDDAKE